MCWEWNPSFDDTEDLCHYCSEQRDKLDEDGDSGHDNCDYYTEEACACRNSEHKLGDPQAMFLHNLQKLAAPKKESETVNV